MAKSEHGNHDRGQESYLYLRNKFMKCYSIRCGVKLQGWHGVPKCFISRLYFKLWCIQRGFIPMKVLT